jgi:hypothetical protein
MEIAAAAAVLVDAAGPAGVPGVKESLAAATGNSYDTVARICDENCVDLHTDEQHQLARGLAGPVVAALRLSVRREPQRHHIQMRELLRSHPHL